MDIKISSEAIFSFVGDVLPIWLSAEQNLKFERIEWSRSSDIIDVRSYAGCSHGAFRYGVLVTLLKSGEATVTARYNGNEYVCRITSRERHDFSKEKPNFYKGDFHTHTTPEHEHDKYLMRTEFLPGEYLEYIKDENLRDAAVMTDHSETIDHESFFRNFIEYENRRANMEPIVYAGCENEIMYSEFDRFGREHRLSGELVTVNANNFCQSNTYPEFFWAFRNNPYAIGIFAHPHVIGISTKGVWNYRPRLNNSKELRDLIKYVEVLNAPRENENIIHEYVYSECLDAGYRVSTTCGSDMHRGWDFSSFPAATIIMAPEKSREAFTDALLNLRAYACESGNIKLTYKVNGIDAPSDIPLTNKYHFEVKIDYFRKDNATRPIRCDVISDGGMTVKTIENVNFEEFEFDIESETARWFYLRFIDSNSHRTFSPPVFCSRPVIPYIIDDLSPIDKSEFKIYDKDGSDASALIDDDSLTEWESSAVGCELTVDMGSVRSVEAIGCYMPIIDIFELRKIGLRSEYAEAHLPIDYIISTSSDGVNYEKCAEGLFRSLAGEEIVRFAPTNARFVKLEILSNAGSRSEKPMFANINTRLAEISLFERVEN